MPFVVELKSEAYLCSCALCVGALFSLFGTDQSPSGIAAAPAPMRLSVDEAVAGALQTNPEIRAAARRLSLAQLKTRTARSLDDPMLMVRDWDTPLPQALGP